MAKRPSRRPQPRASAAASPKRKLPQRTLHLVFAAIGLVLLAVFFGDMILKGSAPKAPDTVAADAIVRMSYTWEHEHGEMPLWTPAVFSGMPSYGSMIYVRDYTDLTRAVAFLTQGNLGLTLLVFFAIAGACLYALLIRYGRSPLAAFFAASVYVFTPYFPGLISAGHNNKLWAAAIIPPLLLVTDGLLRRRSLRAFAWFALVAAWQFWARHPQVTYYGMMFIGCIVLADILVQEGGWMVRARRFVGDAALLGGGLVLALAVVALPYLPVLEFTPESVRGSAPSAASELAQAAGQESDRAWEFATGWSMHPKELITFVVPSFYGLWNDPRYNPQTDVEAHSYWGYMPFTQSTHYFGLIPLVLALLVRPNRHGIIWGAIGFSVLALFIGLGHWFPVLYWPAYKLLPYFAQFRVPSMIYMLLPLSVGVVGAWALDQLMGAEPRSSRPQPLPRFAREERIGLFVAVAMTVLALLVVLFHGTWGWAMRPQEGAYPAQIILALTRLRGQMLAKDLMIAAVLTALVVGGLLMVSRRRLNPLLFGVVLVVATLADLWRLDFAFLDVQQPTFSEAPPTKPQEVDLIRQDVARSFAGSDTLFRIAPIAGVDPNGGFAVQGTNEYGLWNLQSVSGYHAAKLRIYDDLMISGGLSQRAVLNMLNARYFIGPPGLQDSALVPLNQGPKVVYRNLAALPRAWWAATVSTAPDRKTALAEVINPLFDPAHRAIVLARLEAGASKPIEIGPVPSAPPRITEWDFHRIVIETTTDANAFLVLSEVYYPHGWSATIDGNPATIYQTNYVLRGVEVPAGNHTVVLTYTSQAYAVGRILTGTLFPLLLLVIVEETWRARRRHRSPSADARESHSES